MKIEKGKLYLDVESNTLFKADMTTDNYPNGASNKIAVHCPFKEDFNYVFIIFKYCNHTRPFVYINEEFGERHNPEGYHIITIEKFKEFYPEVETSDTSIKSGENVQNNVHPAHYTNKGIQPIDYIEANKLDFNEGNVIKYVTRYKDKNGLEDLKKAKFYLERLISNYETKSNIK